ncbi:hypothetical protein HORIV_15100 [Vreelandella olivaria]|uniref:DUF112 domain-containing protein n=1 Tax=Vreelandella olivaria TaxID=390919 RepID=A0ABM7GF69_9GAMM|nr:hypothetical protein HORIV_15100 [Halomonas olivaria]
MPGAGGSIASLVAYDQARRFSKTPEKFGKGHGAGIVSVESANNALLGGALIPTLALGIPGEAATAVLLGGLMIQGVTPGPMLFESQGGIIYGIFLAYLVANFFMLIIMCLGIKLFVRVLLVPRKQLISAIIVFCFIGVYGVDGDVFNLYIMLAFGLLGYFLNRYGFGTAPVILGLILGPIAESNLRRGCRPSVVIGHRFSPGPSALPFSHRLRVAGADTVAELPYSTAKHGIWRCWKSMTAIRGGWC